jgi:hypothetical protein
MPMRFAEATARGWTVQGFAPDTSAVKTLAEEAGVPAKTLAALARARPAAEPARGPQLWGARGVPFGSACCLAPRSTSPRWPSWPT